MRLLAIQIFPYKIMATVFGANSLRRLHKLAFGYQNWANWHWRQSWYISYDCCHQLHSCWVLHAWASGFGLEGCNEASNTILLVVHLPDLKEGPVQTHHTCFSLGYASFCMKIDGASKLGETDSQALRAVAAHPMRKILYGSSMISRLRKSCLLVS